jgi:hypothetical protein
MQRLPLFETNERNTAMRRLTQLVAAGALLALCVKGLPAAAQNQTTFLYATEPAYEPLGTDANKIAAMQQLADLNLTEKEITSILPLLIDLRDARSLYVGQTKLILADMVAAQPGKKTELSGPDRLEQAYRAFDNHRENIWRTISDRIGADRAHTLRLLVQAMPDTSFHPTTSARMLRIEQLVAQLNASTTVASAGTSTPEGAAGAVNVQSVPPATAETSPTIPVYTRPLVSSGDLVRLMEEKLIALNATPEAAMQVDLHQHDLTSPTLEYFRSRKYWHWE